MKRKIITAMLVITIIASSMSVFAKAPDVGKCGDNVSYSYNRRTGTLTLTGSGDIYECENYQSLPWGSKDFNIYNVEMDDGVKAPLWMLNKDIAILCGKYAETIVVKKAEPVTKNELQKDTEDITTTEYEREGRYVNR